MSENVEQTGCPSFDSISAYLDGEAEANETAHIESCQHCQRILASLRTLDEVVTRSCQPPEGLSARILAACSADREAASPTIIPFWGRPLIRYAAAIVITFGLAFAVKSMVNGTNPADDSPASGPMFAEVGGGDVDPGSNPIDPAMTRVVSAESGNSAPVTRLPVVKRVVSSQVNHIWGGRNLDRVEKDLAAQLPEGAKWGLTRDNAGISVQASLTDEQLQKLINGIHAQGYDLFSPELPQPNQEERVEFMGGSKKVIYQARFVNVSDN